MGRTRPDKRSRSWQVSLVEHRNRIPRSLEDAPSLARELAAMVAREYPRACRKAMAQTGLDRAIFPPECPWTVEQLLDHDFYPESDAREV